jgi:HSP20 family protein
MLPIQWQSQEQLNGLDRLIDRVFDETVREEPGLGMFSKMREAQTPWMPAIELRNNKTELILQAQVPGLVSKQLDIQISDNAVFLTGEYEEQPAISDESILRSEFHYGKFSRVVPLPTAIQQEHVTAEIVDGLLTVIMPKAISSELRVVKVLVGNIHTKSSINECSIL